MVKRIFKNPQAIIGLILIAAVTLAALFAPAFAPHDPEYVDVTQKYLEPCEEYPLGTDQLGRCEFSRLLYGARYSLGISLPILLMLSVIGLLLGTLSACAGQKTDRILTIICDTFISFPSFIIAVAVIGVLGNGISNMLSIGFSIRHFILLLIRRALTGEFVWVKNCVNCLSPFLETGIYRI